MRTKDEDYRAEAADNDGMDREDLERPHAKDSRADEEPRDVDLPAEGAARGAAVGAGNLDAHDAARMPRAARDAANAAKRGEMRRARRDDKHA